LVFFFLWFCFVTRFFRSDPWQDWDSRRLPRCLFCLADRCRGCPQFLGTRLFIKPPDHTCRHNFSAPLLFPPWPACLFLVQHPFPGPKPTRRPFFCLKQRVPSFTFAWIASPAFPIPAVFFRPSGFELSVFSHGQITLGPLLSHHFAISSCNPGNPPARGSFPPILGRKCYCG